MIGPMQSTQTSSWGFSSQMSQPRHAEPQDDETLHMEDQHDDTHHGRDGIHLTALLAIPTGILP